jgi:hypothetical protein
MIESNYEKLERLYGELKLVDKQFDRDMRIICWVVGAEAVGVLCMIVAAIVKHI